MLKLAGGMKYTLLIQCEFSLQIVFSKSVRLTVLFSIIGRIIYKHFFKHLVKSGYHVNYQLKEIIS